MILYEPTKRLIDITASLVLAILFLPIWIIIPILIRLDSKGSVFYTDDFKSYKDLKHYGKHSRVKHSKTFGKGKNHINGIEGFWSYAKERFHKYHGINKKNYGAYIKEMEFRFNHRNEQLYPLLVDVIRQFAPKIH